MARLYVIIDCKALNNVMKLNLVEPLASLGQNLVASLLCLIAVNVLGAPPAPPKDVPSPAGYLSKTGPGTLRFAPVAKPGSAPLPPLPITPDPQPAAAPQPATVIGGNSTTAAVYVARQPAPVKNGAAVADSASSSTNAASQTRSPILPEAGMMNPQMFLRFFPNGKPAGVGVLLNDAVNFEVPIKETRLSSSASYEVR